MRQLLSCPVPSTAVDGVFAAGPCPASRGNPFLPRRAPSRSAVHIVACVVACFAALVGRLLGSIWVSGPARRVASRRGDSRHLSADAPPCPFWHGKGWK